MPSKFIIIRNRKWVISFFLFLAGWLWNIHQLPFSVVVRCSTCLVVSWDPVYGIPCIFSESQGEFVCRSFPSFPTSIQQKQRLSQQHSKTRTTWTQDEMRKKTKKGKKCHTHIRKKKKINSKILFCLIVFSRRISLLYFCSCFLFVDWMWDAKRVSLSLLFSYAQYIQAVVHLSKLHMNRSLTWGFCWTHQHAEHMAVQ